jgi:hypothetical protein
MNNTNGNLSQNLGKLLTDRNADTFRRLKSFTEAVVYLHNLRTNQTEQIERKQFFKWINTGALEFINP